MNKNFSRAKLIEDSCNLIIRVAIVIAALPFLVLGLTLLPVIGLLIGFVMVALAFSPLETGIQERIVDVLVGSRAHSHVCSSDPNSKATVPVAILTSRGFDATRVEAASVVMGHKHTGYGPYKSALFQDGDGIDLVLCVPESEFGNIADFDSACVEGRTIDGESFRGCTTS